jgi:hypothetical protein
VAVVAVAVLDMLRERAVPVAAVLAELMLAVVGQLMVTREPLTLEAVEVGHPRVYQEVVQVETVVLVLS